MTEVTTGENIEHLYLSELEYINLPISKLRIVIYPVNLMVYTIILNRQPLSFYTH